MMVEKDGRWKGEKREKEGEGGRRRKKEREEAGEYVLLIKQQAWRNGLPRPQVSVCRIHKGGTKRLCKREPKVV